MKRLAIAVLLVLIFTQTGMAGDFIIQSSDIKNNGELSSKHLLKGFGCDGENLSPNLSWSNPPAGTKSFAVTVYDPDAPTGSGWWHWVIFNIPDHVSNLDTGASGNPALLPIGALESRTDFGTPGFGGACPPKGSKAHRYQFTVHALNVATLPLSQDASGAMVGFMIHEHSLGSAQITVNYGR